MDIGDILNSKEMIIGSQSKPRKEFVVHKNSTSLRCSVRTVFIYQSSIEENNFRLINQ